MQNYEQPETEYIQPSLSNEQVLDVLPPTPNNPPWNSWVALSAWLASVIFIILLPNIFVFPYLAKQELDFSNNNQVMDFIKSDPTAILLSIVSIIPAHILTFVLAWVIVTRVNKFSFFEMTGWKWGGFKWWHLVSVIIAFFVLAWILIGIFGNPDNDLTQILKSSTSAVYIVAFLATFTAPLVEEVIYRGILYSAFQRSFGVYWAVAVVTFLFLLVHLPQYWGSTSTILIVGLLSLTLTLIRVKTDNLLPCIALHTVFNGLQAIAMVAETFLKDTPAQTVEQTGFFIHLFK